MFGSGGRARKPLFKGPTSSYPTGRWPPKLVLLMGLTLLLLFIMFGSTLVGIGSGSDSDSGSERVTPTDMATKADVERLSEQIKRLEAVLRGRATPDAPDPAPAGTAEPTPSARGRGRGSNTPASTPTPAAAPPTAPSPSPAPATASPAKPPPSPLPAALPKGHLRDGCQAESFADCLPEDLSGIGDAFKEKFPGRNVEIASHDDGWWDWYIDLTLGSETCPRGNKECWMQCPVPCHVNTVRTRQEAEQGSVDLRIVGYCGHGINEHQIEQNHKPDNQKWVLYQTESSHKCPQRTHNPEWMSRFDYFAGYQFNADFWLPAQETHKGYVVETKESIMEPITDAEVASKQDAALFLCDKCESQTKREVWVKELMTHIRVDSGGSCLHNVNLNIPRTAPLDIEGKYRAKIGISSKYKFYLAFENSFDYGFVTERFPHALMAKNIPVYLGPTLPDWYLPGPKDKYNTIINAADFKSSADLGVYLQEVLGNEELFRSYFTWRSDPLNKAYREAWVERMLFPARHETMCRMCATTALEIMHPGSTMQPKRIMNEEQGIIEVPG